MTIFITIFVFLIIFSCLILIHELGHFYAARRSGVKVEEFGFGLPPRIWGVRKGETLYSVNWIPFGGFVKLLGEDSRDPKLAKDKKSFISKPPRVRILIVVAGVLMNFLLAFVLLTIGFIFGIQPLILNSDDVFANLQNGTIDIQPGFLVKNVVAGGPAELAGLQRDDNLLLIDGKEIVSTESLQAIIKDTKNRAVSVSIERDGIEKIIQISPKAGLGLGFEMYEVLYLPRLRIQSVRPDSASAKAGLMAGDTVISVDDKPVYVFEDYIDALSGKTRVKYTVLRGAKVENFFVDFPQKALVVVTGIFPDTPAEKAGLRDGDVLLSLDGQSVSDPESVVAYTKKKVGKQVQYQILRNGETLSMSVTPNGDGLVGVGLSTISSYENSEVSLYGTDVATSVVKINDVRYPVWIAPIKALEESARLSVMTVEMFVGVLKSVVTRFSVPDGVAGPVGIAQLTYVFVQEGVFSVMRFMAILSLSLAIINVLPLPALDGGRLLFIVLEVLIGRRVGQKFEAVVHTLGFVLLMVLIFLVTYSDIIRVFF